MITYERANELFEYHDGKLLNKITRRGSQKGKQRGYYDKDGYLRTHVDKKEYSVHRIIFLLEYGFNPKMVDHIDRNPGNNHIGNLRACTQSQNTAASGPKGGSSKYKGVHWREREKRWTSSVFKEGRRHYLGYYKDEEEAAHAYDKKAKELHGDFAYQNFTDT